MKVMKKEEVREQRGWEGPLSTEFLQDNDLQDAT